MHKCVHVGLDVGSTTVKLAVLDRNNQLLFQCYERHYSDFKLTIKRMVESIAPRFQNSFLTLSITGSGGLSVAKWLNIPFIQEVIACTKAVEEFLNDIDVVIELGGEDAKITFFKGGVEQRMNGTCAGGTGAFIDQMAVLLHTDAPGVNELAKHFETLHPIAARCGVFAKSDIQPLLNDGAKREDIAASIFQAVVNQTISGLACGRKIKGRVAFLGGPLYFLTELRKRFVETLKLEFEDAVFPENSQLFVALGAALASKASTPLSMEELLNRLTELDQKNPVAYETLQPLFKDEMEYDQFKSRHQTCQVNRKSLKDYQGDTFLGIDCGSTTTKMVLIDRKGNLLYEFYQSNEGKPLEVIKKALIELYEELPKGVKIMNSAVTGYGEALIKSALRVDLGEIETVAHYKAADYFVPGVDFILDIGGQDMKCLTVKDDIIQSVVLNEACSAGCGSFLQSFAQTLNISIKEFVQHSLFAKHPVDLGSRCTVFMNSKVKQAQKEGAEVGDIASGLSYSVIKNALYKVIKLRSPEDMGEKIIVQGGTFYNDAVLRAFELISNREAYRPDIAGLMGAFGCAIIAKERSIEGRTSSLLTKEELRSLTSDTRMGRCKRCENQCVLTIHQFSTKEKLITGNRCERGAGKQVTRDTIPNLFQYKYKRMFDYEPLLKEKASRGTVGLPRVLNMYENYSFWFTFFTTLGYRVILSPRSSKQLYERGMDSIPSESTCYPAKLVHGHILSLLESDVDFIFYPGVVYEHKEFEDATNQYNCPIVISYSESIRNNVEELKTSSIPFVNPFISLQNKETMVKKLVDVFPGIPRSEIKEAIQAGIHEHEKVKKEIQSQGEVTLKWMEEEHAKGIVLAGRPYHIDPEINHGLDQLITSYGMAVLTEDSISHLKPLDHPLRVVDQWVYHSRLYRAANVVAHHEHLELIQLNSFGCGLDAVTTDQVKELLENNNKIYTCLKIDEVSNIGSAKIRIRSLKAAMDEREKKGVVPRVVKAAHSKILFTKEMKKKHTILCPQMSPIHFEILEEGLKSEGYNFVVLKKAGSQAVEEGLKYVNNDACFPSILVTGQLIEALKSGEYDIHNTSVIITQTGGGCRATNYIAFIRKSLEEAGFSHVPVISLNASGFEKNPGFKLTLSLGRKLLYSMLLGDLLMRLVYATRPYETTKGTVDGLYHKWNERCKEFIHCPKVIEYRALVHSIVNDFDHVDRVMIEKPKIGLVGEILVKFHPDANNAIVNFIESEGGEAVMPDLTDFFFYSIKNMEIKSTKLYVNRKGKYIARTLIDLLEVFRKPMIRALEESIHYTSPVNIHRIAEGAEKILSLCNQTGEGWFLTGEMVELIESGTDNIVCMQPFACLPNHIVGKSVFKEIRHHYPKANIVAVDYDPGASEVNQINRIKLMLAVAFKKLEDEKEQEVYDKELIIEPITAS